MNTTTLEFPYINEQGFSTAIHPFVRPDIVIWKQEPIPSFIGSSVERPFSFSQECCCDSFNGFSGYVVGNVPAVPEASTWLMIVVGIAFIKAFMVVKKWKGIT